jgi:hypothetical protein
MQILPGIRSASSWNGHRPKRQQARRSQDKRRRAAQAACWRGYSALGALAIAAIKAELRVAATVDDIQAEA